MKAAIAAVSDFILTILPFSPSAETPDGDRFPKVFLSIMIFLSGLLFIGRILNPGSNTGQSYACLIVNLAFCILFLVLYALMHNHRMKKTGRFFLLFLYGLFCIYPLIRTGSAPSALVWMMTFPFISAVVWDYRKGLSATALMALLSAWFLRDSGLETLLQIFGAYAMMAVLSCISGKHLHSILLSHQEKEEELSRLKTSQSRFLELYTRRSDKNRDPRLLKNYEDQYRKILDIMADVMEKKGEFYVFYRKDVISTLLNIPHPDAVLSYILLEGISNVNLFDPDRENSGTQIRDMGDYLLSSCNVEDFFSKIESVIELRKAKKSLEFNKIQTQIDRVFPRTKDEESGEANLVQQFEQYNISEREADIARCILKGLTNKEISLELYISIETVKTHVKNILKKCGISSRIELIRLFSNSPSDLL